MVPRPNELGQPIGLEKGPTSYSARVNVTTRASTVGIGEGLELSPGYLISLPGILKIVQLVSASISLDLHFASPFPSPHSLRMTGIG